MSGKEENMKKQNKMIPIIFLLVITGCSSNHTNTLLENDEAIEVKSEVETVVDASDEFEITTETNRSDEVLLTEENMLDETKNSEAEWSTENDKEESNADMEKYKGKKYTFYKTDFSKLENGMYHKIRGVYSEYYQAEYHGLFLGQVVTLFGAESLTENNEDLISHAVAAENENGDVIYLEVYYGPSGPAIGGQDGENYEEAAKELEDIIRNTVPIDFEAASVYEDVGVSIRMGTKNGKGFYETEFDEGFFTMY